MKRLATYALFSFLVTVTVAIAGCGVGDPYAETVKESDPPPAEVESAARPVAEAGRAGPAEVVVSAPASTLRYAASLAGNWDTEGAVAAFSKLAAISTGEARSEFAQISARARSGVQAALGYSESESSVEAVSLKGGGRTREAIVVVRQRIATAQMPHLPPEYRVILATLSRWGNGWAISSWEPQP